MYTLGVDTSALRGSVALFENREFLGFKEWSRLNSHGEQLTIQCQSLLTENHIDLKSINRLALGIGPGSFTGIRVGVNFARSLSYALKIPLSLMNSLQLIAHQTLSDSIELSSEHPIFCATYGFRNLNYVSVFRVQNSKLVPILEPTVMTFDQIFDYLKIPHLCLGTTFTQPNFGHDVRENKNIVRRSHLLDEPRADFFKSSSVLDENPAGLVSWSQAVPLYIRASEAEEKMKSGALSPLKHL